jgi:DNA mismatch endonuclease (patch repair protein)
VDKLTKIARSDNMRKIRHKDTAPELAVRRIVTSLGYRYRLHVKDLPGKPDLVFRRRRLAIFVHGCFWHMHRGCREGRIPGSRVGYWRPKIEANVKRDQQHFDALVELGWRVLILWECEIEGSDITARLEHFLA